MTATGDAITERNTEATMAQGRAVDMNNSSDFWREDGTASYRSRRTQHDLNLQVLKQDVNMSIREISKCNISLVLPVICMTTTTNSSCTATALLAVNN